MEKQTKIATALLLATVLAGLIIVIILMPSDERHPCQKAALDHFNMYKEGANILGTYGVQSEEYEKYWKEFQSLDKSNKNLFEVNNCESTYSQWVTPEFKKEMQSLLDEGF